MTQSRSTPEHESVLSGCLVRHKEERLKVETDEEGSFTDVLFIRKGEKLSIFLYKRTASPLLPHIYSQ